MRIILVAVLFASVAFASPPKALAQKRQSFDLASFVAPKGWTQEVDGKNSIVFTTTDKKRKTYCRIFVLQSAPSKGAVADDFTSEWTTVVLSSFPVKTAPSPIAGGTSKGWTSTAGSATFEFNGGTSSVLLTTWSGHQKMTSVLAVTDDEKCLPKIVKFLKSVQLRAPASAAGTAVSPPASTSAPAAPAAQGSSRFKFTTVNFDDGWTAVERPDWVQATKAATTVLIHHPPLDKPKYDNLDETTAHFWKALTAPRYRRLSNVWFRRSFWSDGDWMNKVYFASANAEDVATGKPVFVVLFKMGHAGRWIEVVTADKAAFETQFGVVYAQDGTNWDRMAALANYNKFAVAASDFAGTWKSSSGAGIEYFNVYTGNSMGMATSSATDEFVFDRSGAYTSDSKMVMGTGANLKYGRETYSGKYTATDWTVTLTKRFQGKTEVYSARYEAVKGGRILHLVRDTTVEYKLFLVK